MPFTIFGITFRFRSQAPAPWVDHRAGVDIGPPEDTTVRDQYFRRIEQAKADQRRFITEIKVDTQDALATLNHERTVHKLEKKHQERIYERKRELERKRKLLSDKIGHNGRLSENNFEKLIFNMNFADETGNGMGGGIGGMGGMGGMGGVGQGHGGIGGMNGLGHNLGHGMDGGDAMETRSLMSATSGRTASMSFDHLTPQIKRRLSIALTRDTSGSLIAEVISNDPVLVTEPKGLKEREFREWKEYQEWQEEKARCSETENGGDMASEGACCKEKEKEVEVYKEAKETRDVGVQV